MREHAMTDSSGYEETFRTITVDSLSDACVALFSDYGITLLKSDRPIEDDNQSDYSDLGFVALISLTNPDVRLSVVMQTQRNILEQSFPSDQTAFDDSLLQDWVGELSNQLSGRLKNKLLAVGCSLELGIPTVIQGERMHLDLPRRSEISRHGFMTESGQSILLSLTTLIAPGIKFDALDAHSEQSILDEGEMLFF